MLCIAWWTVQAQLQKTNSARQVWEYKTLVFWADGNDFTAWWEDGNPLPIPINGVAKRAELGNLGWELAGVTSYASNSNETSNGLISFTTQLIQYYKRPK